MEDTGGSARQDWSIQEVARIAGTTSRTLRHYDDVGLLAPSRVGSNGYRYYNGTALLQLQRILLLRELGRAGSRRAAGSRPPAAAGRLSPAAFARPPLSRPMLPHS